MSGADASATAGGLNPHLVCGLPISTAHAARCTALSLRSAEPLSMTNGRTLFAFLDRQRLLMATVPAVRATMKNMALPGRAAYDQKKMGNGGSNNIASSPIVKPLIPIACNLPHLALSQDPRRLNLKTTWLVASVELERERYSAAWPEGRSVIGVKVRVMSREDLPRSGDAVSCQLEQRRIR
jgi:hypothetical protein